MSDQAPPAFPAPALAVAPSLAPTPPLPAAVAPDPALPDLHVGEYVIHDHGVQYIVVAVFPDQFTDDHGARHAGYVLGPANLFTHPQPRDTLYTLDEWEHPEPRRPAGR